MGKSDIETEAFFSEIENYKSEFAFNLASQLKDKNNRVRFTVPTYIKNGFEFLR